MTPLGVSIQPIGFSFNVKKFVASGLLFLLLLKGSTYIKYLRLHGDKLLKIIIQNFLIK